jgi:hypothetical protein
MREEMEIEFEQSAFEVLAEDEYAAAQTCQLPTAA